MDVEGLATRLCREVRELSLGTSCEVERIQGAPTPLRFLRDFVLPNKPCIITHAIDHWPALTAWTNSYLRTSLTNQWVSVHSTPNGLADAVVDVGRLASVVDCTIHPDFCNDCETALAHQLSTTGALDDASEHANSACNETSQEDKARLVHNVEKFPAILSAEKEDAKKDDEESAKVASVCNSPSIGEEVRNARDAISTASDNSIAISNGEGDDNIGLHVLSSVNALSLYKDGHSLIEGTLTKASSDVCGIEPKEETLDRAWFVSAHVDCVPFPAALDMILHSEIGNGVVYAQEQNGCFVTEYSVLSADAETHLPWATEALGCLPEAANLWIGNEKAVTSFHKDHYENLYAVIAGEKHFTLLPPTDLDRLYIRQYPSARYVKRDGKFAIQPEKPGNFVPWASVDPYPAAELELEAKAKFPKYFGGPKPFTCTLRAGEILYLPSLWFHHVRQSPDLEGRTIALNFWYDMQFDIKYAYYNFLESLILES
ncbi:hypothetical protein GOP47_0028532 [Adiantum capillus-veneris]|nr:hypothetical protein GOP47_0028532 [Adiantum capillus-veneris]